jgi:tetraacyldisaccharide 4'-kinase
VLSRGYGRRSRIATPVDLAGMADEFGDEPLLIARQAGVPVYVAPQRYDAGLLSESAPAPPQGSRAVHILDDGFQHRQLHRDIDILLLNRADWLDRLLPAGNLRETLNATRRADVIAIPATEPKLEPELRDWGWQGPIWRLHRRMQVPTVEGPVFAFCGIACPEQFFAGLRSAGLRISGQRAFADHHCYTSRDLERLAAQAHSTGASILLTTEKDEVRLAGLKSKLPISTVSLRTDIEDEPAALDWIINRLQSVQQEKLSGIG